MKILTKIFCLIGDHDWTCKAGEGIPPTKKQLESVEGFKDYAKMYCKRCDIYSKLNERLNNYQ